MLRQDHPVKPIRSGNTMQLCKVTAFEVRMVNAAAALQKNVCIAKRPTALCVTLSAKFTVQMQVS
jgi:hypothetical protein